MRIRSQKTVERLQEKSNKNYNLTECPRCGDEMEYGTFNYIMTDYEAYFKCEGCGIRVTHIYDWVNSEVELLEAEG